MCEILAPAGDEAAFCAALGAGADAVYVGLKDFSARRAAANFTDEAFARCVRLAHMLGAKVYVALNTLVKDAELSRFFESARTAWNAGADALILQDVFLGKKLKQAYPQMVLHLSTQAGVCNEYGARLAKRMGFSRVILARETPFEDVERVARILETEVFVQGALCTCFSGQCYFSSLVGGNSGNRGLCKQPCRKRYGVDRAGFEGVAYRLSLSDLCMGEEVKKLKDAGVLSFKIEGRMRSAAYVGAAVSYYRDLLSNAAGETLEKDLSALRRTYNRGGYTKGYLFGQDKNLLSPRVQGHMGERIGRVERISKNDNSAFVRSAYFPAKGDGFKILRAGEEVGGCEYRAERAAEKGGFYLHRIPDLRIGDEVYLTLDNALSARLCAARRGVPLALSLEARGGKPLCVTVRGRFGEQTFFSDFVAAAAQKAPFSREELIACFCKTDAFPYEIRIEKADAEGDLFFVRSQLNAFRREVFARVADLLAPPRASLAPVSVVENTEKHCDKGHEIAVIDRDFSSPVYRTAKVDHAIFKPKDYRNEREIEDFFNKSEYYAWHKWLYLPAFMTGADIEAVLPYLDRFDGVYAEGVFSLELCRERGVPLFAGTGFNLFNSLSVAEARGEGARHVALSKELSLAETSPLCGFLFSGGGYKLMELGHCLFSKSCAGCDRRSRYTLTDESGRAFPLLRYENSACRFELYNCLPLAGERRGLALFDLSPLSDLEKVAYLSGGDARRLLSNYTSGAQKKGIT